MKHLFIAVMAMIVSVTAFGRFGIRISGKASRLRLRPGIFRKEYMLMFQPVTICFLDFMSELAWG